MDVAILFGDGRSKHGEAHRLFREEVFPVCSPRLVEGLQLPLAKAHLARLPMLHLKPAQHARWFRLAGVVLKRWPSIGSRFRRCSASTTTPC
ncbi:LysR substrate-binding domain-containing protein [Pseudomonas aeruginosa]|uniref:LysR substrate-binding domain-containing protein n=1 Tax=Pseudomonas aeruginosa TaxID=287 RepID=UPI003D08B1BD